MSIYPISLPPKKLAQAITSTASSFKVNNIKGWDGVDLVTADLGSQHFVVFRNETGTIIEIMEIDPTTVASASITILKRGLEFDGTETEVTANKLDWAANETTINFGTDAPQLLNNFVDKSRNQTITGYKTVPTPTADGHIATKAYVDGVAIGGTVTKDQVIVEGNAGETVAAAQLVYLDDTDNEWKLVDADTATTINNVMLGIAQGAGTNGNAISGGVLIHGIDKTNTGLTQGAKYYASNTAGSLGTSTGTTERVVGFGTPAGNLYFDPYFVYSPTAAEKASFATLNPAGVISAYAGSSAPSGWLMCDGSAVSRTTYATLFAIISTTYGVGDGSTTFNLPFLNGRSIIGAGTAATKIATFASRASNVITATGLTDAANNEFQTGQAVLYSAPSGAMTGLTDNTTYYIIRVSNTTFSLATSLANAQNGTAISLSSDGTGTQTFTLSLTARTLADTGGEENHAMSVSELLAHIHAISLPNSAGGSVGLVTNNAGASSSYNSDSKGGNAAMNNISPFLVLNYIIKI